MTNTGLKLRPPKYGTVYQLVQLLICAMTLCGFSWGISDPCSKASRAISDSPDGLTDKLEQQILDKCPDGAAGHFVRGLRFERSNDPEQAMDEYRQAVEDDPSLNQAHGNLGLLLLKRGSDNEAASELSRALAGKPDPRYHRGLAILLGKGKDALLLYHATEALKGNPDDPVVHALLADAYAIQGQFDDAIEEYNRVLDREPSNEHARLGLADAYDKSGNPDNAIRELSTAALANPKNGEIHKRLAVLYRQTGDSPRADRELSLAGLPMPDPGIEKLVQQGDQQYLARNYDRAIEIYGNILKNQPNRPDILEKSGDAQMAAGRDDEAIKSFRQTLTLDPKNPSLHYTLGILYERGGLLEEAETEYRNSLNINPENGDARRRLADIYTLRGNSAKAIAEYRELIKQRADNPLLHFKLARLYVKNRDYTEAIREYQTAIKLAPENPETHKELGVLHARRGEFAEAGIQYQEVLRLKKDDKDVRKALTSLLVKQKKYDDLLALMKQGVEVYPNDPNSHYKLGVMYEFMKDYPYAISQYHQTIALKNNHVKAMKALGRLYIKTGETEKAKSILEAARAAVSDATVLGELMESLSNDKNEVDAKNSQTSRIVKKTGKSRTIRKRSRKKSGH